MAGYRVDDDEDNYYERFENQIKYFSEQLKAYAVLMQKGKRFKSESWVADKMEEGLDLSQRLEQILDGSSLGEQIEKMEWASETLLSCGGGNSPVLCKLAWMLSSRFYELANMNLYSQEHPTMEGFDLAKKCNCLSKDYFEKGLKCESREHAAGSDVETARKNIEA